MKEHVEEKVDLFSDLKMLNWDGDKFLSQDLIKELDEQLKNELSESELL